MVVPFLTLYITGPDINRSLSEAGFVMTLFGLGAVIGAYFGGKFSDRIGFFNVQLISLCFGGVMFIVLGQIKSYSLICVFTFLLSLINESFRPANSSAVAFYSNSKNRTRSYSLNRLSINLGWAFGASLGGIVASVNYEWLFWIDGITNMAAAILLITFLKPAVNMQLKQKEAESVNEPIKSAYKDKVYLFFVVMISLFALCFFQLFTTVPNFMRDELKLNERFIGLIMALNGLLIVLFEMVIIYHLEKKNRNIDFIMLGLFICSLAFLAMLIPGPAKWISVMMILLITVGEVITMPFMNAYWTIRSNSRNRGQYAGLYSMAWAVSQTAGPYLSTRLVESKGFKVLFLVMALLLILCAFGFYFLKQEKPPLEPVN